MVLPVVVECGEGNRRPGRGGRSRLRIAAGLVATAFFGLAGAAESQVLPPTREEIERPPPERVEPRRPSLTVEGGVERAPCALDRPEYENIRFRVNDVQFEDLRGLPPEALRPAFAPFVGQEHPVSVVCEIRDRAATILREAGYVAAVEVPEQRIADGNVRFRVLMARLVGLRVRGNAGRAEELIASYLNRLTGQEVFNRYDAERYLLLAGDLPGYNVRLALRSAGTARGEVIGEVIVVRIPALVDFTVQNYGSSELGRWGGVLRGQIYGLTGLGDRTIVSLFSTADFDEQQTVQVAHDFRVGSEGLTFGGQFTYAWARPDLGNPAIDIDSETLFASAEASYPFIRTQSQTLRGAVGLDFVNQDTDLAGIPLSRDRLRVAFVRATFDALGLSGDPRYTPAEPLWRFGASAEIRHGLDIFGATDPCGPALAACQGPGVVPPTRLEGDPTALLVRGSLLGEFRPAPELTFAAAARAQYSADPLLSFEEISAGNYTVGRGYDPGSIVGDSGVGVQVELRAGSPYPRSTTDFAFQPFVFIDQAWAWNEDRLVIIPRQELTSVGGGVRVAYGDRFRLELTVAAPLDRTLAQPDRDPRFLLTFTTRLWPWSS